MTIPSRFLLLIPVGLIILGFVWFRWIRIPIAIDQDRIYTILITKPKNYSESDKTDYNDSTLALPLIDKLWSSLTPPIKESWVLFYYYPQGKFYLFEIDSNTSIKTSSGTQVLYRHINENIYFLKKNLVDYYGIEKIDFEITLNESESLKFLEQWGGGFFFNLYSTNYSMGEVYINQVNYKKFIDGISDTYLRKLTAQSFWFNLLVTFEDNLPHKEYHEIFLSQLYESFSSDFNYPTFITLVTPLLKPHPDRTRWVEENTELQFGKNNIEVAEGDVSNILIPYQAGAYDREKINNELSKMKENLTSYADLNITTQIKNATKVNFLAARAAGFFRLKGINISEYLRFSEVLPHSVILDYANNANKRNYIKNLTKINRTYHWFSYRENFDLAVYLGENFYLFNRTNDQATSVSTDTKTNSNNAVNTQNITTNHSASK